MPNSDSFIFANPRSLLIHIQTDDAALNIDVYLFVDMEK